MNTIEDYMTPAYLIFIIIIVLWEGVWKAFALWRAAKNDSKLWYILLILFNTAGILPIVYLFVISKKHPEITT